MLEIFTLGPIQQLHILFEYKIVLKSEFVPSQFLIFVPYSMSLSFLPLPNKNSPRERAEFE